MEPDVALIVGKSLTAEQAAAVVDATVGTSLHGAGPADVLSILGDGDCGLPLVEDPRTDAVAAGLAGVPDRYRLSLVAACVRAAALIEGAPLTLEGAPYPPEPLVEELVERAVPVLVARLS